jgi:hypothetical protein
LFSAAKARGVKLGSPPSTRLVQPLMRPAWALLTILPRSLAPVIAAIQKQDITGLRAIARELTARKVETRRGGTWTPVRVGELLKRIERLDTKARSVPRTHQ